MERTVNTGLPGGSLRWFLSWWTAELDGIFSQLITGSRPWGTLLYRTGEGIDIYAREGGGIKHIGHYSDGAGDTSETESLRKMDWKRLASGNVVLRISSELALTRELTLPAAISDVIEPVVKNQVEQIVPWPSEQTSFGYEVDDRKGTDGNITVRLAAIRTGQVDAARAHASKLGFEPGRIEISEDTEQTFGLELVNLGESGSGTSGGQSALALVSLFAISVVIGITGLWQMLSVQTDLKQAEEQLAILTNDKSRLGDARVTNAKLILQRNWLVRKRKREPSVAITIDALTRLLPDDTQLLRLEISGGKIVINGRAKNAAELISRLEKSMHFKNVRFYSPTIRKSAEIKETFSIEAELEPANEKGEKR